MREWTLGELAALLEAELHAPAKTKVTGFATDSGEVHSGDLFLAFRGSRFDGHDFVGAALKQCASAALVERSMGTAPHLLVPNVVDAIAKMAGTIRSGFTGPVIAITGSAGKTTTKEFVASALSPLGPVLKTRGNRNSEYTSPLLWAELTEAHRAVVVEMAMRGFGQIRHLAAFTKPTIGLVTNIGFAHLEQVGSREGIADAKGELLEALPTDGVALLWREDDFLDRLRGKTPAAIRTFGTSPGADSRVTDYRVLSWNECIVAGETLGQRWETRLPAVGRHLALNAAAAVLTAVTVGVDAQAAASALEGVELPPMRMQIVQHQGADVLLDNYNASPPSMIAAIETLSEMPVTGRRRAVIGEMRELGDHVESGHRQVGEALAKSGIEEVLLFGKPTEYVRQEAIRYGMDPERIASAEDIDEVRAFLSRVAEGDAVLIKGSRALGLERAL